MDGLNLKHFLSYYPQGRKPTKSPASITSNMNLQKMHEYEETKHPLTKMETSLTKHSRNLWNLRLWAISTVPLLLGSLF
jgi:hypothetical protein